MDVTTDDPTLLRRYAASRDEAAFAELARRHVDLVYAAAVRRVGDRHMAEDVTQAVFVILAKKPNAARASTSLAAWLLTTARYAAANAMKRERRRQRHERVAAGETAARGAASANPSDVLVWQELAALLDDAVLALGDADRRAVLMRFFERRPVHDVALALNVSDDAAKQRLARALDKLRRKLARRAGTAALAPAGATAALAGMLTAHAVRAAPPALLHASRATALAAASGGAGAAASTASVTIAKGAITMMTWTKIKTLVAGIAIASAVGTGAVMTLNHALGQTGDRPAAAAAIPGPAAPAGAGSPGPAAGQPAGELRAKAAARVKAAEVVVKSIVMRREAGEPMSAEFIEMLFRSYRHLADARIDAADQPAARISAAEEYVKQCSETSKIVEAMFRAGAGVARLHADEAAYHVADADYLLAKLRAAAAAAPR